MKDQRQKVGLIGKYQLGSVDRVDVKKRKLAEARCKSNKVVKTVEPVMETGDRLTSISSEDSTSHTVDFTYEPDVFSSRTFDLENMVREADRYCTSC